MSEHVKVKITEGIRKGDIVVADERHGACIKREWIPAVLRALVEQAGGVETKAVRRSHGALMPAGAVPMPGDKIVPALLLPLEAPE